MKEHLYNLDENYGNSLYSKLACGSMREFEKRSACPILANESGYPMRESVLAAGKMRWFPVSVSSPCSLTM